MWLSTYKITKSKERAWTLENLLCITVFSEKLEIKLSLLGLQENWNVFVVF